MLEGFEINVILIIFAVPQKVENVMVLNTTTNTATLQWTKVNGTANVNYTVLWQTLHVGGSKIINDTNLAVIDDLMSNTEYTFQVQANNRGGSGLISELASFPTSQY